MKISVLFIHPIGSFGGASRSLLELLKVLADSVVAPHVICPAGQVAGILERQGVPVLTSAGITQFDNTFFSYYRRLRWLILGRELSYVAPTINALRRARLRWPRIDIIHVNELTALPGAILAKRLFRVPLVVHVRSVQRSMDSGLRGRVLRHLVRRHVDQLVAIDCTVRASLPPDLPVAIVRNGFPAPQVLQDRGGRARVAAFSKARPLRVACVGGLLKLKGVYEFVEAARLCLAAGQAVEFMLVGENPRELSGIKGYLLKRFGFAADVRSELLALIEQHQMHEHVRIVGFTQDIAAVYDAVDVLCFPSHLNACGRPVFEAAFSFVPSIVAVDTPQDDTIVDGVTGICIDARDPQAIADAIGVLYADPARLERMGIAAFELAKQNFDIASNTSKMIDIYERLARPAPL